MTAMLAPEKLVTPEDLLELPDAVNYELVDGKLVERHMGMESSETAATIIFFISQVNREKRLGHCFGADAGYQCFPGAPDKVRKPDVSFVRSGRLLKERSPKGHCKIPPDLAVEVISPGDKADAVENKVAEYLAAGVPLIWLVYPSTRSLRIRRPESSPLGSGSELSETATITGEDILPGFSCRVAEFFA